MLGGLFRQLFRRGTAAPGEAPAGGWPGRAEALRLQQLGKHREAAEIARATLAVDPDNIEALQGLAASLFAQGESSGGMKHLRHAAALAPDSAELQTLLATVLASAGDPAGAIEGYRRATRVRPDYAEAWAGLAALLKAL